MEIKSIMFQNMFCLQKKLSYLHSQWASWDNTKPKNKKINILALKREKQTLNFLFIKLECAKVKS